MDKTAQKFWKERGLRRNVLQKLHDLTNVPAHSAENFFKPELKRLMNALIDTDDVIRSTLTGSKIGKAIPEDKVSVRDLLKEAKSFVNRREYLSAVSSLGRFHKKMQDVANVLDKFDLNVNSLHHQFLFNKLPGKHREQLEELDKRFAAERLSSFTKEGGLMDFFHNIGTQRGRALAMWEKKYPQIVGKLRDETISQLDTAQNLLDTTLEVLKEMATARANRNIDQYITAGKQLASSFKRYDSGKNGFRNYYNNVVRPYMNKQRELEAQEKATSETAGAVNNMIADQSNKNLQDQNQDGESTTQIDTPSVPSLPSPVVIPVNTISGHGPTTPSPAPITSPTEPSPPNIATPDHPGQYPSDQLAEQLFGKKSSHQVFVKSLNIFANEPTNLLALHISKYARSIQANDPESAIKLFKIAKSLRG